jgi:N-ethylmaleimide reductase
MGIFEAGRIGDLSTPNRIVMAPLGRGRNAEPRREALSRAVLYYAQRASAGLIISEATHVSASSVSRPGTAAVHSDGQVVAWRKVTTEVHAAGGRIFQQLFHLGRKADPDRLPGRATPVAPSPIAATGSLPTLGGTKPFPVPRALALAEIPDLVEQFRHAASNSKAAGFDGIELHAANGFLIEQFLRDDTNHRIDDYGGSVANRSRFLLEVVDAAIAIFGPAGVGVRVSPHFDVDGPGISDPADLFGYVAHALDDRGIAYLHVIEPDATPPERRLAPLLRTTFRGPLILAGEFDRDSARAAIEAGRADFVAFGRLYIANPDLVERFRFTDVPLNPPDESTFNNGGDVGYTDYPALEGALAQTA